MNDFTVTGTTLPDLLPFLLTHGQVIFQTYNLYPSVLPQFKYLLIAGNGDIGLSGCSSEKRESSLLEKKLKDRVTAVNKFYKENSGPVRITITSPIKVSLNLKENSAVTDTEREVNEKLM